jgi:hypothetical protein
MSLLHKAFNFYKENPTATIDDAKKAGLYRDCSAVYLCKKIFNEEPMMKIFKSAKKNQLTFRQIKRRFGLGASYSRKLCTLAKIDEPTANPSIKLFDSFETRVPNNPDTQEFARKLAESLGKPNIEMIWTRRGQVVPYIEE